MTKTILPILASLLAALPSTGCGSKSSDTSSVTPRLAVTSAVAGAASRAYLGPTIASAFPSCSSPVDYGLAFGTPTSLQYFITKIQLCESMTLTGTGYTDKVGCVDVYVGGNGDNANDTYKVSDALADTTNYIDLLDSTSRSKLSASATAVKTGTYAYGIIETRKPVKMKVKVDFGGGDTVKTCGSSSGTLTVPFSKGSGGDFCEQVTFSGDFSASCAEETVTFGTLGGGRFFKFLQPITLTKDSAYFLDLAFNPTNVVPALRTGDASTSCNMSTYQDAGNGAGKYHTLFAPQLSLSPVLRSSAEKTIRESYSIAVTGGTLLINLYFVGATTDVGKGNVVAAGAQYFTAPGSCVPVTPFVNNPQKVESTSGAITLTDYQAKAIVRGLTRSTTATPGSAGTVTVDETTFLTTGGSATASCAATFTGVTEL